jgi:hypothetical protein
MHELAQLLTERIANGLQRKSITNAGKWACAYRVMGKPFPGKWGWTRHPWLKAMHESTAEVNIGQKAAQMGYTENVLNIALYNIDVRGVDCLYVFPAKTPDASDFSAGRFNTALELSPHINNMFSNVKNVGHKRAGNTNLYLRGAKSRSGLKSIPVGILILDEKDEMVQENIPLAKERQSGYDETIIWEISTPTIDGIGINETFELSTQNEFFFKCPSCSRFINLTFPESIEIIGEDFNDPRLSESFYKCSLCDVKLPHETKTNWLGTGRWIPKFEDRSMTGWGIGQMYSSARAAHPSKFLESFFKAKTNPAEEQEFFNSKLGVPHIVDGARINEKDIDSCIGTHVSALENYDGLVTIGIDVGNDLHFEIDKWFLSPNMVDINAEAKCLVLAVGKVAHFEELDTLMQRFNISAGVVDVQPERRKAYEFACRFWGKIRLCFYGRGISGKNIHLSDEDEMTVTVDRTSWLDMSLSRFRSNKISLPRDVPKEYREHIKALTRIYEKDIDGNPIGKYVKSSARPDHFAHARNYSEIALPLAASMGRAHNISGVL